MHTVAEALAQALSRFQFLRDELSSGDSFMTNTAREYRIAGDAISDILANHFPPKYEVDLNLDRSTTDCLVFTVKCDAPEEYLDTVTHVVEVKPAFIGKITTSCWQVNDAEYDMEEDVESDMFLALTSEISLSTINTYYQEVVAL